jgi:hypothetical protein
MCQASLCLWNMVAILPIVSRLSPFAYWWCLRHIARHRFFLSHFVTRHGFGVESPSDTLSMLIWWHYKSLPKRAVAWEVYGYELTLSPICTVYFVVLFFCRESVLEIMDWYFSGLPFPCSMASGDGGILNILCFVWWWWAFLICTQFFEFCCAIWSQLSMLIWYIITPLCSFIVDTSCCLHVLSSEMKCVSFETTVAVRVATGAQSRDS